MFSVAPGILTLKIRYGICREDKDDWGSQDPQIRVFIGEQKKVTSVAQDQGQTPEWNEELVFECDGNEEEYADLVMLDKDPWSRLESNLKFYYFFSQNYIFFGVFISNIILENGIII